MKEPESPSRNQGTRFASTAWSLILRAQGDHESVRRAALSRLASIYWPPVYWTIRREWSIQPDQARDLTQDYFAMLLEEDLVNRVAPERGLFRSYVKATLRNFMLRTQRHGRAQRRGGGTLTIPLDDIERLEATPRTSEEDPARAFNRDLMRSILATALDHLDRECARKGHQRDARMFRLFYGSRSAEGASYRRLEEEFSVDAHTVKNALARLRIRYRQIVLGLLRDGVSSERDLWQEVRAVFEA